MALTQLEQSVKQTVLNRLGINNGTPRFEKVPAPSRDVWGFLEDLGHLIHVVEDFEAKHKKVLYTEEYGDKKEYIDEEIITYEIIKRTPGTFEQGNPGTGLKMRKPVILGTEVDPVHPQYKVIVQEQWYDNFIELGCWALSLNAVMERVMWLEGLLTSYAWFFEMKGYHFRYEGLGEKMRAENKNGHPYFGRPLVYWVRGHKTYRTYEKTLDTLVMDLTIVKE